MSKLKKLLIVWAIAFASLATVPAVSYVMADPCMDDSTGGSGDCYYGGHTDHVPQTPEAGEWADAFVDWCEEDGYKLEECIMASEAYERAVNQHLAGNTVRDPRLHYPAYYPGGSKNTVPNPTPPTKVKHPGKVPEPVPEEPERGPGIECSCHYGDPTVHEYPA